MINEIITVTADKEAAAVRPDYESEIISVIRSKSSPTAAQTKLEDYHGSDIAQAIDSLTLQERKKLCRICSPVMLAEALEHLEEEKAAEFFSELDVKKAADVVEELDTDTAANILHTIDKQKRELIIEALPADVRRDADSVIAEFAYDDAGASERNDARVDSHNVVSGGHACRRSADDIVTGRPDVDVIEILRRRAGINCLRETVASGHRSHGSGRSINSRTAANDTVHGLLRHFLC